MLEEALTIEIRPPTLRHDASEEAARDVSVSWHPEERLRGLSARELAGAGAESTHDCADTSCEPARAAKKAKDLKENIARSVENEEERVGMVEGE